MSLPNCSTCGFWKSDDQITGECWLRNIVVPNIPAAHFCSEHSNFFLLGNAALALAMENHDAALAELTARSHNQQPGLNTGDYQHLTVAQLADVVGLPTSLSEIVADINELDDEAAALTVTVGIHDTQIATLTTDKANASDLTALSAAVDTKAATTDVTTALALKADLDGGGKIPITQLPALAISDTFPVADEAEMLALSAERGDTAIRADVNKTFILRTGSPSVLGNWSEMLTPTDGVFSFNGRSGTVSPTIGDYTPAQVGADPAGSAAAAQAASLPVGGTAADSAKVGGTTPTTFGKSLIDDADANAARTTLGLGTAATAASSAFDASGSAAAAQAAAIAACATAAQGVLAASALQPGAAVTSLSVGTVGVGQVVTNVGGVLVGTTPSGGSSPSWHGVVYGAYGGCDPQEIINLATCGGSVGLTPTNLSITVARIAYFRPPANITFNKIRFFGVGATTNVFRTAIYNGDTLARLSAELAFSTAAQTWGSAGSALNLTLTAGQLYFIAIGANATGTTAGPLCFSPTIAATTGQIGVLPKSWPGSLDIDFGHVRGAFAQFAVTAGALPATAPTIAAQAAWTGGFPAFWLDSSNA